MAAINTLKSRRDFQRAKGGATWSGAAFLLDGKPAAAPDTAPRFGFTVTKKLAASAVVRNRMRRRLKEAVRAVQVEHARLGHTYVLIARSGALDRPFEQLCKDVVAALERVHRPPAKAQRRAATTQ